MAMTLTEILEKWLRHTGQAHGSTPRGVVVSPDLFAHLAEEQGRAEPIVGGLAVLRVATDGPARQDLPALDEVVEISGPDRVSIYVGLDPESSPFPAGLDPEMPVVFVPVPPDRLDDWAELETYSQLRWFGVSPEEAMVGAHQ